MSLNHRGTVVLETPRLMLRPVVADDEQGLFDSCLSDPLVTRYISISTHSSVEDTAALLQKSIDSYEQPAYYFWAMVPKDTGSIRGIILAFNIDERHHKCEIGYYMSLALRGQGLGGEALRAVVDFLFGYVGFMRLEARCDSANIASARVLEKTGFLLEGCLRKSFFNNDGVYVDSNTYGLLREEWEQA